MLMQYRRARIKGGVYFFTGNLTDRSATLLTDNITILRSVFRKVKSRHPFVIEAMVVLPEHLHTIWRLPQGDDDYPSRRLPPSERLCPSRIAKGERGVWQRRYWEHLIRDEEDFVRHVDYIHYNPVKHGYVQRPLDWPQSSIHRYIVEGMLPVDWGATADFDGMDFGEAG